MEENTGFSQVAGFMLEILILLLESFLFQSRLKVLITFSLVRVGTPLTHCRTRITSQLVHLSPVYPPSQRHEYRKIMSPP